MWIASAGGRFGAGAVERAVEGSVEVSQAIRSGAVRGAHRGDPPSSVNNFSTASREAASVEIRAVARRQA
jgi:hypothetical protein